MARLKHLHQSSAEGTVDITMLATITVHTEPDNVWGNFRASGLESLGYAVDSSITPLVDCSEKFGVPASLGGRGGRDYRRAPLEPYHPAYEDDLIPGSSQLLEVPVTVGATRRWPGLLPCHRAGPDLLQRVLRKTRISEVVPASPPEYDGAGRSAC